MLKVEHLSMDFGVAEPLKDINCEIKKGDVICVMGSSGCGKSTFINCLNRMVEPTGGKIIFDGEEIKNKTNLCKLRQKMGMVFQSYNLFPHLTIIENMVVAPRNLLGMEKEKSYAKAFELLRIVGLSDKWDQYPSSLSGGQQQRIAIVRALMMEPEILLLDEPTSALDPTMVSEVETVIRELATNGLTMIIVTHSLQLAKNIASRIFYLDEGVIYEEGPPEVVLSAPTKEKTRWFVRQMKVFYQKITSHEFDYLSALTALTTYGQKQRISTDIMEKLHILFEDLCVDLVLPNVNEPVVFSVAYDEENERAEAVIEYMGNEKDFMQLADEEIRELIYTAASDISYKKTGDKNQIIISVTNTRGEVD